MKQPRFLHIAAQQAQPGIWTQVFRDALERLGPLTVVERGAALSEPEHVGLIHAHSILLTGWGASPVPRQIAADRGGLEYICHITGTLRDAIPWEVIESGIPVTNWGDAPANDIAEGTMALLLATLKDLHKQARAIEDDAWALDSHTSGGALHGLNVGLYGFGAIGKRFAEMIRPFNPVLRIYDPYVKSVHTQGLAVNSLEELFSRSEAVVILAALNATTRRSVTAELLARLPKYGIVINTARGAIVDQEALLAELASGRLRAGLDVLEPDELPKGHPARKFSNCTLTAHAIHRGWPDDHQPPTRLSRMHLICLDNVKRHMAGEALRFLMDRERYLRST